MNDEIKEIIEDIKLTLDVTVKDMVLLNRKDIKQLLDYITNLQKENERLTKSVVSYDETLLKRNNEYEDYKSRNKKAIEHLKEVMKDEEEYEEDYIYNKYLLDILQGSDKE